MLIYYKINPVFDDYFPLNSSHIDEITQIMSSQLKHVRSRNIAIYLNEFCFNVSNIDEFEKMYRECQDFINARHVIKVIKIEIIQE